MDTINKLNLMPSNKSEVSEFIFNIKDAILEGEVDPLDVARQMSAISALVKEFNADKEITYQIIKEAEKYEQKSFEAKNCKIQIKEVGVKFDFSKCGHSGWHETKQIIEDKSKKLKDIETTLKTIRESSPELVDTESGEMLRPAARSSTTKAVITLL